LKTAATIRQSQTATKASAQRFDSLQALRAVAAIMVVLFHLQVYTIPVVMGRGEGLWPAFAMGYAGVEIFFVLSGFIMVLVHRHQFGQTRNALPFVWRRVERIYPVLWIVLAILIALRFFDDGTLPSPNEALRAFTLWPTAGAPVLEVSWSLTFEMLFYLIFALFIVNLRVGVLVGGLWFAASFVSAVTGYQGWGATLLLSPYNVLFLLGILAALAFRQLGPRLAGAALLTGAALYLSVGLAEVYGALILEMGHRTLAYGIGAMAIVAGLAALELGGRLRVPVVLRFLGDASYAIYLVHVMAMTVAVRLLTELGLANVLGVIPMAVLAIAGALIGGSIAHLLVERPLLRWLRARRARLL
jgi:exopolysaccharide production protein ExoZ